MAADALCAELPFDHHLGGNPCMIGAGLPERIMALHPMVAGQRVHDGVVKTMSHVQAAGDVWRGEHDGKRRALTRWLKVAFLFPALIPVGFQRGRVVGGGECGGGTVWRDFVGHERDKNGKKLADSVADFGAGLGSAVWQCARALTGGYLLI